MAPLWNRCFFIVWLQMREKKVQLKLQHRQPNKSPKTATSLGFEYLPSLLSLMRVIILPFLVYSFIFDFAFAAYALFLLAIGTDFLDGYLSRKMKLGTKFGAYFDATVDFIFIIGMFRIFVTAGLYPYWVLPLMLFAFVQFIITSFFFKKIYDPIGKYYGSMLYGAIGLTLVFSGQLLYDIITISVVGFTTASLCIRLAYLFHSRTKKHHTS
jgi:phosphatidylglycerophosphate synthase